jgi:hypothetical protein
MNLHVIQKTVALRYDGGPMWPIQGAATTDPFPLVDAETPVALVHRRLWLAAFADPTTTGMPEFRMQCEIEDESGARVELFDWRVDYKNSIAAPQEFETGFTGIRPPYVVTNEPLAPDRSSASHSGAGDARVMQFTNSETLTRAMRCTMWPVDLTARIRRIRWIIRDFAIDGGTGGDLTGNIYTALVMHSQAFPF